MELSSLLRRYRQPTSWKQAARSYENRNASAFVSQRQAPARHEFRLRLSGARASGAVRVTSNKLPPRSCFPLIPTAWFPITSVFASSETAPSGRDLKSGELQDGCSGWNCLRKRQNREANEFLKLAGPSRPMKASRPRLRILRRCARNTVEYTDYAEFLVIRRCSSCSSI